MDKSLNKMINNSNQKTMIDDSYMNMQLEVEERCNQLKL